jgi:alkanesulfonate monooxygenase SsuD/methylene tetrahydromethanopterin reductase-like flavin-dependent oxidoreductase (luciferase family)
MLLCLTIEGQENVSWSQWVALAEACESNGLDGLFRSDHYLPFRRRSGWGVIDAWGTISGLGPLTHRIRLGTLVSPIGFRHPSQLAKLVVTADHISNGRVELGLGAGWLEAEHIKFGFPFPPAMQRHDRLVEYVEVVRRLWDPDEAEVTFMGDHFQLAACDAMPKGLQDPHPRLIIGGSAGPRGAELAARWADEYNLYFLTPEEIPKKRARLVAACEAIGRDPKTLRISLLLNVLIGSSEADIKARGQRLAQAQEGGPIENAVGGMGPERLIGTPQQVLERLQSYADTGIQRVMLQHLLHEDLETVDMLGEEIVSEAALITATLGPT